MDYINQLSFLHKTWSDLVIRPLWHQSVG